MCHPAIFAVAGSFFPDSMVPVFAFSNPNVHILVASVAIVSIGTSSGELTNSGT